MRVELQCQPCGHKWQVADEPRDLVAIACPACHTAAEPRASEDLASALEDALCQLHLVGQTTKLSITLSTDTLPPPFIGVKAVFDDSIK